MTNKEAMQMALDALETIPYMSNKDDYENVARVITALRAALAQGEQEPHGYLWFTRHMEQRFTHRIPKEDERIGDVKPVYTAPPQREWQGLTEQDTLQIRAEWEVRDYRLSELCRAIEAKLKEKNK